jgi:hypothetical protein
LYFGDAKVEKAQTIEAGYLDLDGNNGYALLDNATMPIARFLKDTDGKDLTQLYEKYGKISLERGVVAGKTSQNGAFICLSNTQYPIMGYNEIGNAKKCANLTWYTDSVFGLTKADLEELVSAGYTTLTMDIMIEKTSRLDLTGTTYGINIGGLQGATIAINGEWHEDAVTLNIADLINNFAAYQGGTKYIVGTSTSATMNINIYLGDIQFK